MKTIEELSEELEIGRMRLAACGVASVGNTPDSIALRLKPGGKYYSSSYASVCAAVDREVSYRIALGRLQAAAEWVLYAASGIGRAGGEVEEGEESAAYAELHAALDASLLRSRNAEWEIG